MAKILVNYPSRSRPFKFMKILQQYVDKSSNKNDIHYFIKIDKDDVSMNSKHIKFFIENLGISYTLEIIDDPKGKIDVINRNISNFQFDVVVCIADDMEVITQDWDEIIVKDFNNNYNLCLNYDTDPRLSDYKSLVVLPIIGKELYSKFGYIYHPDYISEYCDNEQTEVFEKLGALKHINSKIFNHDWWGNQDGLMQKNIKIGKTVDKETYNKRKAQNFV